MSCAARESGDGKVKFQNFQSFSRFQTIEDEYADQVCFSSHKIVVFPALSNPNTRILASLSPKRDINLDIHNPCKWQSKKALSDKIRNTSIFVSLKRSVLD
jgi:hypothetical protein